MALPGKYIYCFIRETDRISMGNSTIAGFNSPVYTLPFRNISALVSDTNCTEFVPARKNLLSHQHTINKAMENYTVIPVAFGTAAKSREAVEKLIEANYDRFMEQFSHLENKLELGLRVTWEKGFFNEDIENNEIKALKKKVEGKKEEEVLTEKIALGKLVEKVVLSKKDEYAEKIFFPLCSLAAEGKRKENTPIKTVFDAYFLIDKSRCGEFDRRVEELYRPYENKLSFSYTGPWPPYNFVSIRLNMEEEG
ncbi:hypothetical protein SDC9_89164 [bioreactor metagenome]|uniref:Gas vesicle synthesis protein GvpL/GvpF n=1 Tax=bioreactor metagenome TaxID=1076179 RepID=A0A644ZNG8_9ZZZZ